MAMDLTHHDTTGEGNLTSYREVTYPRRMLAPEAEQFWAPAVGAHPQGEHQVDEFLLGLPTEAIAHYVTAMEEGKGSASRGASMRAMAFWFRDKRERWVSSRMSRRDPAVVALARRASALASGCLLAENAEAEPGELALALSLLGATADTLDGAGQREALDLMLASLSDMRDTVAQSLSHDPTTTVPEACRGIGDLLTLPIVDPGDFHAVTGLLLSLWGVPPLAASPASGAPPVPPLSHAKAVAEICERAYIAVSNRADALAEDTAAMAAVPLAVLSRPFSSSTTLSERILAVHIATGLLAGMLKRYGGPVQGELPPLQNAVERALALAESPPRLPKKAARQILQRAVRGHVAGAFAQCTPRLIEHQLESAGLPLPRGVPELEPPEIPQRLSSLLLTVLVDDTLRLSWALDRMSSAGIGDADAIADLDAHVQSEHFAQLDSIGAALGEAFVAEPPASSRRLAVLRKLGRMAKTVYEFALDAGMVALMRRLPAAQAVLKASYQAFANFGATALAMPPRTPEELEVMSGKFYGLWKERMSDVTPLVARLTGDECAALVLAATQLEVFQTQAEHEDGYAAYYQGLSDAVAACFAEDYDEEADDQVDAAEQARLEPLAPWKLKLLECVPEYSEMISIIGGAGAQADWKADPAVISRCYLSTLMVGAPDVLPQYPWEVIEQRIVPTSFLLLQHRLAPLNERTHGIFRVLFEAYPDKALSLMPQYMTLSLSCFPALTQPTGFEDTIRILARTLTSDDDADAGHSSLEWALQQLRSRCDALIPVAENDDMETGGQQAELVAHLFRIYASFFLHVEIPSMALVRFDCERWLEEASVPGPSSSELGNKMLFDAIHGKVFESFDYTRKFELSRWYIDTREKYAMNSALPKIEPPKPHDPNDPFGLGARPPLDASASGEQGGEEADQLEQMTGTAMQQNMAQRLLSRIRGSSAGGLLSRFQRGDGNDRVSAAGAAGWMPEAGAQGVANRRRGGGRSELAREAGWVWPLSRM